MTVIGSQPGMGRTSLALNVALHAALHADKTVAIISGETNPDGMARRLIQMAGRLDGRGLRGMALDDQESKRIGQAVETLLESQILLADAIGLTPDTLKAWLTEVRSVHGLDLAVVDGIEAIWAACEIVDKAKLPYGPAGALKRIALQLNTPVISTFVVVPETEEQPLFSDLPGGRMLLGIAADVVMIVHRETALEPTLVESEVANVHVLSVAIGQHR